MAEQPVALSEADKALIELYATKNAAMTVIDDDAPAFFSPSVLAQMLAAARTEAPATKPNSPEIPDSSIPAIQAGYVEALRAALEFYRDEWETTTAATQLGVRTVTCDPSEALLDDCGERAKVALAALRPVPPAEGATDYVVTCQGCGEERRKCVEPGNVLKAWKCWCGNDLLRQHGDSANKALSPLPAEPSVFPVGWTGSGSLSALSGGKEGFIFPTREAAHPIALYTHPQPQGLTREEVARALAASYGNDPDEDAPLSVICTNDNQPLPWWHAFTEQADAILSLAGEGGGAMEGFVNAGEPVTLEECPPGLFLFNGHLGLKTEYRAMEADGPTNVPGDQIRWKVGRHVEAYVAASGEVFWGGATCAAERGRLIVQPVEVAASPKAPIELSGNSRQLDTKATEGGAA